MLITIVLACVVFTSVCGLCELTAKIVRKIRS